MYLKCKRLDKKREKKDGVKQVVDLKFTKNTKGKKKKKLGVGPSCVFEWLTIYYEYKKKDGFDWIVDLKFK